MTTELLADSGHTRGDMALIRQAIRNGWDIPEQLLSALPKVAGAMALDKNEKASIRLKAIETLMSMKESNDRADGVDKPQPQHPQPGTTINVGVRVDNNADGGRPSAIEIVEQIRARRLAERSAGGLS